MAHAELAESELTHAFFGALHLLEHFAGDRATILHARGEAGRGRPIPQGIARGLGQRPHFELGQTSVRQRRQYIMLLRRTLSGTKVPRIVGIHAVRDVCVAKLGAQRLHAFE